MEISGMVVNKLAVSARMAERMGPIQAVALSACEFLTTTFVEGSVAPRTLGCRPSDTVRHLARLR
jgi:hypothetical protein